jgi:hypothetical protein
MNAVREGRTARILLLVVDVHLGAAIAAALYDDEPIRVVDADDPMAVEAALIGRAWDVCVADAVLAADALTARRGRGLVILSAAGPAVLRPAARTAGAAVVLLPIPCSLVGLREAVHAAAAAGLERTALN